MKVLLVWSKKNKELFQRISELETKFVQGTKKMASWLTYGK